MSTLVDIIDVKLVDGAIIRCKAKNELNKCYDNMLKACDSTISRYYCNRIADLLDVYLTLEIITKRTYDKLKRRIENDYEWKIYFD